MSGRKTKTSELAERYLAELSARRLPQDAPVMSVRGLARRYSVSLVTAQRVLSELEERGVIYRVPCKGSFIRTGASRLPVIAYAGHLPCPSEMDPIKYVAIAKLFAHFSELGFEPRLIPYHVLCNPEKAAQALQGADGLLLDAAFRDEKTNAALWAFPGRIVMAGNRYYLDGFPCSQVIPDYTAALRDFHTRFDLQRYSRILLVHGKPLNARADAKSIQALLEGLGIAKSRILRHELPVFRSPLAFQTAFRHFRRLDSAAFADALVISLSDYLAQGIDAAWRESGGMPDLLTIDNLDAYSPLPGHPPGFTSVDRRSARVWCKALDRLVREIQEGAEDYELIRVPAHLVVRASIHQPTECKDHDPTT